MDKITMQLGGDHRHGNVSVSGSGTSSNLGAYTTPLEYMSSNIPSQHSLFSTVVSASSQSQVVTFY